MAGSSLKSFIKDVRAAKTLAEERSIITKASAKIRTKLRDDHLPLEKRRKNIQKLLYLYILGEKTHFGQVECINLIASDDFTDKRLGYLAATLLLDESEDLLTLLTNLLNNDLNHPNKYVVSLALTTLGFLSSSELARDLYPDVEHILNDSKDPFLVKKALQCTAKLIVKDFSLLEIFSPQLLFTILSNHSICTHGVLLSVAKVLQSILLSYPEYQKSIMIEDGEEDVAGDETKLLSALVPIIPELLTLLQNLNTKNFEPEFDIQGTCDPFLQCEILYTLRLFFQIAIELDLNEISQYTNKFNDLLTQIATNTDGSKNCGQAILYETARTIFSLNLDQPLRVLGVNILAKFLSGKDNNTKYVALNTLLKVVPQEPVAVQRHRKFISRCLRDPDVSIKRRALELSFAILDDANIVELVNELMLFLETGSEDDKNLIIYTVENLVRVFDMHSVDEKWQLDTLIKVLKLVGTYITPEIVSEILIAINNGHDVHHRSELVVDILKVSLDDSKNVEISEENIGWELVTIWCIGEYADTVLKSQVDPLISETSLVRYLVVQDAKSDRSDIKLVHYILTAALKLSAHIKDSSCIESLRQIILNRTRDPDLMIQTKSVQYELIFRQPQQIKKVILETMPIFEKKMKSERIQKPKQSKTKESSELLFDFLDENADATPQSTDALNETSSPANLLADIFGTNKSNGDNKDNANNGENKTSTLGLNMGRTLSNDLSQAMKVPADSIMVHDCVSFDAYVHTISCVAGAAHLELYLEAKENLVNIQTFCAVPKTQKLTLGQLYPSNSLNKGDISRQVLKISGSGKLKLRIKLDFTVSGNLVNQQFDCKFDQTL